MKNINKKYLTTAFLTIVLFLKASLALAFEVNLPGMPSNPNLPTYIAYFFGLGVYTVGLVATVSFAIGAVGLLLSMGNSELETESKNRMKGAIIGIIIAVLAVLILNTLNGGILKSNLTTLPFSSPTASSAYEQPGVYFCAGGCDGVKCKGTMSAVMTSDQDYIDSTFSNGQIKGIRIVEDLANNIKYGVILHNGELDYVGECSLPIYDTSTSPGAADCEAVSTTINATAANIFAIGNNSSGNGVSFYSDVDGWSNTINSGTAIKITAGVNNVLASQIKPIFKGDAGSMKYDYTNSNVPPGKQTVCAALKDCLGSIFIGSNGGYLVAVYSGSSSASG